jgi:hypothetical protein
MALDVARTAGYQTQPERDADRASQAQAMPTLGRCPSCAGGLTRLDSGLRADVLLSLQHSRGNAFVGELNTWS